MKSIFKVVYSDRKDIEIRYLPITFKTNFRSFKRASKLAMHLHKDNRDVIIIEMNNDGMIATWEYPAGKDLMIFDFNDELAKKVG